MPQATWTLSIDGIVTAGTYTDISSFLQSATWSLGFASPYEPIARESTMSVVLTNSDQRFSPEFSGGTYYGKLSPGLVIRLQSTDPADSTVRTAFIGWIGAIRPTSGISPDTCTIEAQAWMSRAQLSEVSIPVQENITADAVIDKVLEVSRIYPPGTSAWFLGVGGQSELGQTTELGATSSFFVAETGISEFLFAGDAWTDSTTVWGAIQDTCGREYGRFFQDRGGTLYFFNRHHLITDKTTDVTLDNTMSEMSYEYGDPADMANSVSVKARTRRETASQVVAGLQNPVAIAGGGGTVDLTYIVESQESGVSLALKSPITPAATTDYLVNTSSDGTGTNITSDCTGAIIADESFATRCGVRYTNNNASSGYITFGQLRGTKLDQFAVVEQTSSDATSIATYGKRELTWGYGMDSVATATGISEFILGERKDPRGRVTSVGLRPNTSAALLTAALTHSIFARIAISEGQTGITDQPYFLISETHSIEPSAYAVVWGLESASATDYWVLGSGTLGSSSYLGPI